MSAVKRPTTYIEQINKLQSRGCTVEDKDFCEQVLTHVGYYRITAYLLPYKNADESYRNSISFETVYHVYEFDRKLRRIINSAIEVIEVNLRAQLSYFHAHKYGALGYRDASSFNDKHNNDKFRANVEREIENNKKVPFVKHYIEYYDGQFPIWVVGELFTFGMWSYFFSDLTTKDKKELTGVRYKDVTSWLRCCTDLRNICAHCGRLYFRKFSAIPKGLGLTSQNERSLWGAVLAVKSLYPSKEKWNAEIVPAITALFEEYADAIDLECISFPEDWAEKIMKSDNSVFIPIKVKDAPETTVSEEKESDPVS